MNCEKLYKLSIFHYLKTCHCYLREPDDDRPCFLIPVRLRVAAMALGNIGHWDDEIAELSKMPT